MSQQRPDIPASDYLRTVPSSVGPNSSRSSDVDSAGTADTSSVSQFSKTTKRKILERNGGEHCWHCGGGAAEIAPVISKKDGSFGDYVAAGILTFDHLGDEQNGVPLCPSCHRAFDDLNNPGLIFIPSELEYFVSFELKDYQNRIETAGRHGDIPPRMVPTPEMYSEYLKRTTRMSSEATGGLYWRYTLRDFFPVHANKEFIPGLGPFKEPGLWNGAPTAALRRAFQIIGNPTVQGIPERQLDQLLTLRKLYARKITPTLLLGHGEAAPSAYRIGITQNQNAGDEPITAVLPIASGRTEPGTLWKCRHAGTNTPLSEAAARSSETSTDSKSPQLLKYGRRASTESNIQRYTTMVMS
ncbi:hypothetical protein AYL99_11007 [Fonsecaea erecta]|uniref:HNH nuclease domain-containing protein n=1 Tax=Fonsecaea erecta TaxID=1367422 RepID=A0A178Z495_9EURO|nr:hypothetical protein AYL99_11007 [Fonsecaea erecta]OAP54559.1 hypothetical protein AYL99_11007 [Fonsecaea erecta]